MQSGRYALVKQKGCWTLLKQSDEPLACYTNRPDDLMVPPGLKICESRITHHYKTYVRDGRIEAKELQRVFTSLLQSSLMYI